MRDSCRSVVALLVGLAVAGTAALSPVTAVQAAGAGSISGTVAAPGGPAADVTVNLFAWDPDEANWDVLDSTLTDAQGDYSLSGLGQADYRLEFFDYSGALASEFYDDARDLASAADVPVGPDQAVVGIDATLVPAGHVAGTVTGAEGEPLSGIFVTAWAWDDAGGYWTSVFNDWSEVDGSYDVGNLPPDSYRIGFTDFNGNHVTEYWNDQPELALADPVVVAVGATVPGRDASLAESGHITGTVTGAGAGPLHGVSVTAYAYVAEEEYWEPVVWTATLSDGSYDLAELPPGSYRVGFEDLAGAFVDEYWDDAASVDDATSVTVTAGSAAVGRDAQLATAGHITGTVTGTGGALENVEVTAYGYDAGLDDWSWAGATATTSDGGYDLGGLPSGTYRIEFRDLDHGHVAEFWNDKPTLDTADDISVTAGSTTTGRDAALAPGAHITGTVTGTAGVALDNVGVTAYRWNAAWAWWEGVGHALTDASGHYDLGGLPAGTYRIGFWSYGVGGYAPEFWDDAASLGGADDITVTAAGTSSGRDAQLAPGGSIAGTVSVPVGSQVSDVWVSAYEYAGGAWVPVDGTYAGSGGTYTLRDLPAGTYRIGFEDDAGNLASEYWDDQATVGAATDIVVASGATTGGRNAVLAAAPAATAYENTALPTIAGTPQAGQTLTASPGSWTPAGATYGYQWLAEGAVIPGATAPTLTVTEGLVGKRVSVRVTASGGLPAAGAATSAQTVPVAAAPVVTPPPTPSPTPTPVIDNVTLPKIKGTPKVGKVLKVTHGSWSPSTVTLKYQWLANGRKIRKATKARFTLTRAQLGKKIQVKVTALLTGATKVVVTTRPTAKIKA